MEQYLVNCPSSTCSAYVGSQSLQMGLDMAQTTNEAPVNDIINPNWLLLDTHSTINSINSKDLIKYICACDAGEELQAYTNVQTIK